MDAGGLSPGRASATTTAAGRQVGRKPTARCLTHRRSQGAPYSPRPTVHPMMNAVGGTSVHYWAQSLAAGTPGILKVVSETARRYGKEPASSRARRSRTKPLDAGGAGAVLRQGRVRGRSVRQGRQHPRETGSTPAGNIFEGARAREHFLCPPLHGHRASPRSDGGDGQAAAGLHRLSFAGGDQFGVAMIAARAACMYHGWCDPRRGCHCSATRARPTCLDHPQGQRPPLLLQGGHRADGDPRSSLRQGDGRVERRDLPLKGGEDLRPAGRGGDPGRLRL